MDVADSQIGNLVVGRQEVERHRMPRGGEVAAGCGCTKRGLALLPCVLEYPAPATATPTPTPLLPCVLEYPLSENGFFTMVWRAAAATVAVSLLSFTYFTGK